MKLLYTFNDPVQALGRLRNNVGVAAAGDTLLGSLNGVFYTDTTNK